jgi:hypothetical protein
MFVDIDPRERCNWDGICAAWCVADSTTGEHLVTIYDPRYPPSGEAQTPWDRMLAYLDLPLDQRIVGKVPVPLRPLATLELGNILRRNPRLWGKPRCGNGPAGEPITVPKSVAASLRYLGDGNRDECPPEAVRVIANLVAAYESAKADARGKGLARKYESRQSALRKKRREVAQTAKALQKALDEYRSERREATREAMEFPARFPFSSPDDRKALEAWFLPDIPASEPFARHLDELAAPLPKSSPCPVGKRAHRPALEKGLRILFANYLAATYDHFASGPTPKNRRGFLRECINGVDFRHSRDNRTERRFFERLFRDLGI